MHNNDKIDPQSNSVFFAQNGKIYLSQGNFILKKMDKIITRQGRQDFAIFWPNNIWRDLWDLQWKKICVILTALFGSMALSATAAPLTENKAALPQQCTQLI